MYTHVYIYIYKFTPSLGKMCSHSLGFQKCPLSSKFGTYLSAVERVPHMCVCCRANFAHACPLSSEFGKHVSAVEQIRHI